jgi:hypothetical protein
LWSPHWRVVDGAVTVRRHDDRTLVLETAGRGPFTLEVAVNGIP